MGRSVAHGVGTALPSDSYLDSVGGGRAKKRLSQEGGPAIFTLAFLLPVDLCPRHYGLSVERRRLSLCGRSNAHDGSRSHSGLRLALAGRS